MFGWKGLAVAYTKLACFTILVCLNYSTSFGSDDFSSFNNSTKEERLLATINHPDVSSRTWESQARTLSRRFTGKPEQNMTTKIHAKKDDGSAVWHAVWHPSWHPRIPRGAMHSGKKWRSALWLNAMHPRKKWWIREFVPPSIYLFLNHVHVAARSLRSLRSKNSFFVWIKTYFASTSRNTERFLRT